MEKTDFQKQAQLFLKIDVIIGLVFLINLSTQFFPTLHTYLQNIHLYQRFLALNVILVLTSGSILTFLVPLAAYEARMNRNQDALFYFIIAIIRFILWLEILIRFSNKFGLPFSPLRNTLIFASIIIFESILLLRQKTS